MTLTPYDATPGAPDSGPGTDPALNLRPLSLGELLDRAFNLYFKNIAAFTAIVAIVIVPSTILSYYQSRGVFDFYISTIQQMVRAPSATPDFSKLNSVMPSDALLIVQYLLLFLGFPFAYGAVVAGVSKAYLGLPVLFAESYRFALRRWLAILVELVLWAIFGIFAFFSIFVIAIIFGALVFALARIGSSTFLGVSALVFMIGSAIAVVALVLMLYLVFAMSFIAVVIERVDPLSAFRGAFARMFSANLFWRGFALALALAGINLGATMVIGGAGGVVAYLLKAPALYLIAIGLNSLFFAPFAVVTAAVFYYDVRIRREGYDLQMLADHFTAAPPAAPSA